MSAVLALTAGGLSGLSANPTAVAAAPAGGGLSVSSAGPSAGDHYINYVASQREPQVGDDPLVLEALRETEALDRKHAGGNPRAARQLARLEREAIRTGKNPAQLKREQSVAAAAAEPQAAKLLTILVEFDENAADDFSGVTVPETVFESRECVTEPAGTTISGPLHNTIPDPAKAEHEDNNTFWVDDFSSEHFDKMLFTDEGITERVRPDLTGPDGKPGIDISGYTMKSMYEEMSSGTYTVTGEATPWVEVPHSEGWYGASRCTRNEEGEWEAGSQSGMAGHPDNPRGAGQLPIDAVEALAAAQPDFPFSDYDIEDQGDLDGDGDLLEPDGIVDHVVLVHAGEDKSGGGGAQGTYAIWAHSSTVTGGVEIPGTDGLKISNYIVQPEDSGVGVFAHEYGHDLGLPDLYDVTGAADSDIDFWDLMSSGSHSGPVFQSMPTHMGIWDKWVLGWADPLVVEPGDAEQRVKLGQSSRPPAGTEQGIRVSLPDKVLQLAEPHSGTNMFWTGKDQDWAKNSLTREVEVPESGDARFWMWSDYVIEEDWDFGFVEVSTDDGETWSELPVMAEDGTLVSTPEDYPDPNGRLVDFGDKESGLTGSTDGFRHDYVDLTEHAGSTVQVRLLYATDEAFVERGWFVDDFSLTDDGETVWTDDLESGTEAWTTEVDTFVPDGLLGEGWQESTGTQTSQHFYLAEWRNFDGFDEGLKYAYDTSYQIDGAWKVDKIKYNAPGMLVWYRDATYGEQNSVSATTFDLPSTGSKGGLLIVDSHFDPLRRTGEAAEKDVSTLDNLPSRPQSSNAAFGFRKTYPFTECLGQVDEDDPTAEYCTDFDRLDNVRYFSDSKTYYPGIEVRGEDLFFRDSDASVVLPNRGNAPYSTRVVDENGKLIKELFGVDLGSGIVLGDGKPSDPFGVKLVVRWPGKGQTFAMIGVTAATP